MDVKTAGRTLDLFETFSDACKPLTLSDLARAIGAPVSSCFGLVKTLENRGYLHPLGSRRAFYPTRKMLDNARRIALHDPVAGQARPVMEDLARATGETVVLSRLSGDLVTYVDVIESRSRIRYAAQAGEVFPVYCSASGKAILSLLPAAEQRSLLARISLDRVTPATITRRPQLLREIAESGARGWAANRGEHIEDVTALAAPLRLGGEACALGIAGPTQRMESKFDRHLKSLRTHAARLDPGGSRARGTARS